MSDFNTEHHRSTGSVSARMVGRAAATIEQLAQGRPPRYPSAIVWVWAGIRRQWRAALVALLLSWTWMWIAVSNALLLAVVGAGFGIAGVVLGGGSLTVAVVLITLASLVVAAVGLVMAVLLNPALLVLDVLGGLAASLAVFAGAVACESRLLHLRGCRRLSRREARRLVPLVGAAAASMGITALPRILISQDGARTASTSCRHIVISRSLAEELTDAALRAIIAHELHHWDAADAVGVRFVWACALPLALAHTAGLWLVRSRSIVTAIGWLFVWPGWLLTRHVITPLVADRSRAAEYEADAAAKSAGHGEGLVIALEYIGDFDDARSGWDRVVAATHPPTEFRLEALEYEPPIDRTAVV